MQDLTKEEVLAIARRAAEFQNNPNIKVGWKGKGKNAEWFDIEIKSEQVKMTELGMKFLTWVLVMLFLYFMIKTFM